jgi:hypothetical protein
MAEDHKTQTDEVFKYKDVLETLKAWKRDVAFEEIQRATMMDPHALMTCLMFLVAQGRVTYFTIDAKDERKVFFKWFCDDIRQELPYDQQVDQTLEMLKNEHKLVAPIEAEELARRVKRL